MSEAATERLPQAFMDCLLDSALEPVLDAAVERGAHAVQRKKNASESAEVVRALLAVTVCDPACGPGGLLVAAAGRIARRVAAARGENQSPGSLRRAMREVVGSCIYGVDISGEAVNRAKDRLRQAADLPGMPPPFLDARIRQGNALIGASPELIENGIPDEAFAAIGGDDRRFARSLRRANAKPAPGQATLFSEQGGYSHANDALAKALAGIARLPGGAPADDGRAAKYGQWRDSAAFRAKRLVADAWCAAFCWAKTPDAPPAIVNQVLLDLRERGAAGVVPATLAEIGRLSDEYQFFHWDLEFPDIFRVRRGETRWRGGFSCVLTAPPREAINRREHSAVFRFAVGSGAYPRCAAALPEPDVSALRADLLFAERVQAILGPGGLAGCAVAQRTAAAPGARYLLGDLLRRGALRSLYDFASPGSPLCLLTFAGAAQPNDTARNDTARNDTALTDTACGGPARLAFRLGAPAELGDAGRSFPLTHADAALINPNTGALPAFRGSRDAALVTAIYRRVPVLWDETRAAGNPWKMRLERAFPRVAATGLLRTEQELRAEGWEPAGSTFTRDGQCMLPFYEPVMIDLFDHQVARARYWVAAHGPVAVQRDGATVERPGVVDRLAELGWNWRWLCAWRASVHERAATAAFLPLAAVADSLPLMLPRVVPPFAAALIAAQSSLVFEYVARQKADGVAVRAADLKQLPVPAPDLLEPHLPFLVPRVLELVYTTTDMRPLAMDLDDRGTEPFARDPERRASLRAELDAFFFLLYGISDRDDVAYIIGTLASGAGEASQEGSQGDDSRRTGKLVLAAYDRMSEAGAVAEYETRIFPPPGHGPRGRPR